MFWAIASLLFANMSAQAQQSVARIDGITRYALVIGNGAYEANAALRNPLNDASDVADSLKSIGVKTTLRQNLTLAGMRVAIAEFARQVPNGSAVFFFFAGHGVQHAGRNYLLPIGSIAKIGRPGDLDKEAVALDDLIRDLTATNSAINVIFI